MAPDAALPSFHIDPGTAIAQAQPADAGAVTLASPALSVMTDLTLVSAATTPPGATLDQAEQAMMHRGVRLLFVASTLPAIEGLITTTDLHGDRAQRLVHDRGLRHDELVVADVMTPLDELDAVEYERLPGATVGNLVATLQRVGRNHLLVVQAGRAGTPPSVRGVVSRTQIERQLGRAIDVSEIAHSFAEIERVLA